MTASGKTLVVGIAERKGEIRLEVTENTKAVTLNKIITDHVMPGSTVMNDEYRPYGHVTRLGYTHRRVNHASKNFVVGQKHTNTIEGAWSHLKLSIRAIYIGVGQLVMERANRYRKTANPLVCMPTHQRSYLLIAFNVR